MKTGAELIADERRRQIEDLGWLPDHDDTHKNGELGEAAECYIAQSRCRRWLNLSAYQADEAHEDWPFDKEDWKPKSPIKDLVRAGALIAAEIDRLQRRRDRPEKEAK